MELSAVRTSRPAPLGPVWRRFDVQLLLYVLTLVAVGVLIGFSATFNQASGEAGALPQPVKTVLWASVGLAVFFAVAAFDYTWLRHAAPVLYLLVIALLILTTLVGRTLFGAQMSVPLFGLDFQFSEIGKVLMVLVLASFLASRGERIGSPATIVLAACLMAAPAYLVYRQPDLGTALVFGAILVGMLFLAGASLGWLAVLGGLVLGAAPLAAATLHEYQRQRLLCFLDPHADPQGACYQVVQAMDAVGSGGLLGRGLTVGGEDARGHVPVQTTDFVFSLVGEDLGFIGAVLLLGLFALLLWRILLIGWRARDSFGLLIAGGLASAILFQVVVNVGMVVGVMPVTGIPLPFITYGGSSLISLLFGLGILESVRMRSERATF